MCETIMDGSLALLKNSVSILEQANTEYVIVGGWSPFLLNSNESFRHPGTKDVDILFKNGVNKGELKNVIELFLKNGFLLSAKHDFQLLKEIEIQGKSFIYNIDLLHPSETLSNPELFVDQLEFDIPIDKYRSHNFMSKSIALPESNIIFSGFYEHTYIPEIDKTINLMNEVGCLITKSSSVKVKKRPRDSYDIFLSIRNARNYEKLISQIVNLKDLDRPAYNSLYGIREVFDKKTLHENIIRYCDVEHHMLDETFTKFFEDSGLNKVAENI